MSKSVENGIYDVSENYREGKHYAAFYTVDGKSAYVGVYDTVEKARLNRKRAQSGQPVDKSDLAKSHADWDLTGWHFGELTVLKRIDPKGTRGAKWQCRCSCGKLVQAPYTQLLNGSYVSCGHLKSSSHAYSRRKRSMSARVSR